MQDEAGNERTVSVEPARSADGPRRIGVASTRTLVGAVRTTGPAAEVLAELGLRAGDRLRSVAGARSSRILAASRLPCWLSPQGASLAIEVERDGSLELLEAVLPPALQPVRIGGDVYYRSKSRGRSRSRSYPAPPPSVRAFGVATR